MNYVSPPASQPRAPTAAIFLPPPAVEETAWDILLALHSDDRSGWSLRKLASVTSVPPPVLNQWLELPERRHLITGLQQGPNQEIRAVLTLAGRQLLNRYLAATSDLQFGVH